MERHKANGKLLLKSTKYQKCRNWMGAVERCSCKRPLLLSWAPCQVYWITPLCVTVYCCWLDCPIGKEEKKKRTMIPNILGSLNCKEGEESKVRIMLLSGTEKFRSSVVAMPPMPRTVFWAGVRRPTEDLPQAPSTTSAAAHA